MKKLHARELSRNQPILRFDVILQHDWPIEQCLLHMRVFFGGKKKSPCFNLFIHWLITQITVIFCFAQYGGGFLCLNFDRFPVTAPLRDNGFMSVTLVIARVYVTVIRLPLSLCFCHPLRVFYIVYKKYSVILFVL